jgi:hypothetical protein
MDKLYTDLNFAQIEEWRAQRTCGPYFFLVHHGATSFTAFRSKEGFMRWLEDRGLELEKPLVPVGEFQYQRILGGYVDCCTMSVEEYEAEKVRPGAKLTKVLCNGSWTEGVLTRQFGGRVCLHYLNPNVKSRKVFDYWEAYNEMDPPAVKGV